MKRCVYDEAGRMGMLSTAIHLPSVYHPRPTVTTYQPQAKVASARAYHLQLRNELKAPLVYFKLQPSRQFISAGTNTCSEGE